MNTALTLAPQNMSEAIEFSKMIAGSGMVPQAYRDKPQDILVAVQWGYEVGLQPMQALQNIAVINGKPSVYGDSALALVKADPRCRGVKETIEGEGDAMTARCVVRRAYGDEIEETEATFSVADAKRAKLWGKSGPWTQYPKRMLAMRARGFAIRDAFPDAMRGMITAEEAQDYPTKAPRDVTPAQDPTPEPAPEPKSKPKKAKVEPVEDAVEVQEDHTYTLRDHKGAALSEYKNHDEAIAHLVQKLKQYAKTRVNRAGEPVTAEQRASLMSQLIAANEDMIADLSVNGLDRWQAIEDKMFAALQEEKEAGG